MGVKSTYELTRQDAEDWYWRLLSPMNPAAAMTDEELEDKLEKLHDLANGGEGFKNFIIVRHREPDNKW